MNALLARLMLSACLLGASVAHADTIDITVELATVEKACISYLEGNAGAAEALSAQGYEIRKSGKKTLAIKRDAKSVPKNARHEVTLTVGKKMPLKAKASCQIAVSFLSEASAMALHLATLGQITKAGFTPAKANGITWPTYTRGSETWAMDSFYDRAGFYKVNLAKFE